MNIYTKNFEVLFTHQKQKKNKIWQDGCLKFSGTKAVLYDDGCNSLETFHIQSNKIFSGSDIECERYLISIGNEKKNNLADDLGLPVSLKNKELPSSFSRDTKKRKRELYISCKPDLPSPGHFSKPSFSSQKNGEKAVKRELTISTDQANFDAINTNDSTRQRHATSCKTVRSILGTCKDGNNLKTFSSLNQYCEPSYMAAPPLKRSREELLSLFSSKFQTPVCGVLVERNGQQKEPIEKEQNSLKDLGMFSTGSQTNFFVEKDDWNSNKDNSELYSEEPTFNGFKSMSNLLLNVSDDFDDTDCLTNFDENFNNKDVPKLHGPDLSEPKGQKNEFHKDSTKHIHDISNDDVEEQSPSYVSISQSRSNENIQCTILRNKSWMAPSAPSSFSRSNNAKIVSRDRHTKDNTEPFSRQSSSGELIFPCSNECCGNVTPSREMTIPVKFDSAFQYKQIMKSALKEHLNIILFDLAQRYFGVLSKVDITSMPDSLSDQKENIKGPSCSHGQAKLRAVKKDGPNKGRHFYSCSGSGSNQCKFFKWADECNSELSNGNNKLLLTSSDSIRVYFKTKNVHLYHDCVFERRVPAFHYSKKNYKNKYGRGRTSRELDLNSEKKSMYIVLKYRDSSSLYSKDDIWIISKSLNFESKTTFIARSMFYGPSSSGDLEIEPLSGYSQSNWRSGDTVHAIWACNAATELSCIKNLDEHVTQQHMPLLPYILNGLEPSNLNRGHRSSFTTPMISCQNRNSLGITWQEIEKQTEMMVTQYNLNEDQADAVRSCAKMFMSEEGTVHFPVTLIHGVFGAGKSFLLAVVVLLMVKLFEIAAASNEQSTSSSAWKILISSTTNVAVDRILLGILDLGFDQFVRVGSLRKIAKPILPYSIHNVGSESQELKELQAMLKSNLTSSEKTFVRKSIERHKLGENRKRLTNVCVVGVTCAACTFPSLEKLKFPVVLLDECSQMMESTSLLPIARFGCKKLVLVGDPKQLSPTIQGSEPQHEAGLEQTLFDRFIKTEIQPVLLRTQYRCHPKISSVANRLFYNGLLLNGVSDDERKPLVDFLPTLCFYDVSKGREECSQDGSYFNKCEANFVVFLIKSLLESEVDPTQIGVITQYKSQLATITNSLISDESTSNKELKSIQISTVDAFQGGEKDVIILSCVRTQHVGFIDCKRRTNVALTRAKRHLCIVGCGKMLSSNSLWGKIITFCRENDDGVQSSEQFICHWNEIKPTLREDNMKKNKTSNKKKCAKKKSLNKKTNDTDVIMDEGISTHLTYCDKAQSEVKVGDNEVEKDDVMIIEDDEQVVNVLKDDADVFFSGNVSYFFDTILDDDSRF